MFHKLYFNDHDAFMVYAAVFHYFSWVIHTATIHYKLIVNDFTVILYIGIFFIIIFRRIYSSYYSVRILSRYVLEGSHRDIVYELFWEYYYCNCYKSIFCRSFIHNLRDIFIY